MMKVQTPADFHFVKVIERCHQQNDQYEAPRWVNLSVQKVISKGTGSLSEITSIGPSLWDATAGSDQGLNELIRFAAKSNLVTENEVREMWPGFSASEKPIRGPVCGKIKFLKRPVKISPPFARLSENSSKEVACCTECKCIFICEKGVGADFVCSSCETAFSVVDFLVGKSMEEIL